MKTLTTGEIAQFCDVNQRTVIRWIDRGDLKGFKLPGRGNNRVLEQDFVSFLKKSGMPVPAEFESDLPDKVLIVDDEPQVAAAISRVLRGAGVLSSIATDGFSAGSLLMAERPKLMTLDLSMPGLDGYDVIRFVRQSAEISQTKILVISALDATSLNEALECGADEVMQKPFDNEELAEKVTAMLSSVRTDSKGMNMKKGRAHE
jgi:CheY-like chemotaxis protein